jgi:hypothetical protein
VTGDDRAPAPPPPWAQVIATTIRLWWVRHVRSSSAGPAPTGRTLRRAGVAALVIALIVASAAAIDLARTRGGAGSGPSRQGHDAPVSNVSPALNPPALAAATASRQQAATWVATEVGHDVIVACDPLTCTALQQHGFPAASLAPIALSSGDPLGSGIVVSTAAVRSQLGTRLTSVYAPLVIASFGTGESQVQILVTAPGGAPAFAAAAQADASARKTGGRDLLANRNVQASALGREQLAAGQVDSRLLITIAALAHRFPIEIRGFGDAGPGAAAGTPLRSVAVSTTSTRYLTDLLAFLQAQRAPLLAATAEHRAGRTTVLTIKFTAPSPPGLLSQY